jgi:hypothetical protein
MKHSIWFSCLITSFIFGCTHIIPEKGYIANPKSIKAKKIEIETSLESKLSEGNLILHMNVKNKSKKNIIVDYANCNLSIDADRVAIAEIRKEFKEIIFPADSENYEIWYHPVNSMEYLNKANYRGDLKQKYILKLDFIKDMMGIPLSTKSFTFEMQDSAYKNYLRGYGRESKIQFYNFSFNKDSFISGEKNYMHELLTVENQKADSTNERSSADYVMASNSEIIIENRVINILSNRIEDTLSMNIWIVNMSMNRLNVLLNKFTLTVSGHFYYPVQMRSEFFNYNQVIDSSVVLNQGARFNLLLKYIVPQKTDNYNLNMDWILIQNNKGNIEQDRYARLLYRDLSFN